MEQCGLRPSPQEKQGPADWRKCKMAWLGEETEAPSGGTATLLQIEGPSFWNQFHWVTRLHLHIFLNSCACVKSTVCPDLKGIHAEFIKVQ